jgi:drug/metabolite transporter (DMT)-like permease
MNRLKFVYILILMVTHELAYSMTNRGDLVSTTENVNQLLIVAAQLLVVSLFMLGVGFIMISMTKYKKHKKMPTFIPLQTVVLMFLGGVVLIGLCVIYYYTGEDILGPDYLSILSQSNEQL